MTTPQDIPADVGNTLLSQGPAQLHTGSVKAGIKKFGVVTVRTASTTLTVFLDADNLRQWANLLNGLAEEVNRNLVTASSADVAAVVQPPLAFRRRS